MMVALLNACSFTLVNLPEDPEQLVDLWVAVEERLFCSEFSKDSPSAPNVNRGGITWWTQEYLWSPVPKSNNLKPHTEVHINLFLFILLIKYLSVLMMLYLWSMCCCLWTASHLVGIHPHRNTKGPSQAKVCQFDNALIVNQEVLGFQVPVEDSATVTEVNALQDLVKIALRRWWTEKHFVRMRYKWLSVLIITFLYVCA